MTDEIQTPPPPADPPPAPKQAASSGDRFAAYDTTYQRFVGGTHNTKAKARDAAKAKGSTTIEIREV